MLEIVSLLAGNSAHHYLAVGEYLARQVGERAVWAGRDFPSRERSADEGAGAVTFLCGLLYAQKVFTGSTLELLGAPVMQGARYDGKAVYFSDVIVSAESRYHTFDDLRGTSFGYNDPGSYSGYHVVARHLTTLGLGWEHFGRVVETGSHERSIDRIVSGAIDTASIDSIVLEQELRDRPYLADRIRTVASIGPSPAPPVVVSRRLPAATREALGRALLEMHQVKPGRAILARASIEKFVPAAHTAYDAMRIPASHTELSVSAD